MKITHLVLCVLALCVGSLARIVSVDLYSKPEQQKVDIVQLVQHPRINHRYFSAHVTLRSDTAKKLAVKFFLGPLYGRNCIKNPLLLNTENLILIDDFEYDMPVGDSKIIHDLLVPKGAADGSLYQIAIFIQDLESSAT